MNKLIRAGIKRTFRIKTLYICLAVLFFIGGFDIIKEYLFREEGRNLPSPESYIVSGFLTIVVLSAVLITSFLGAEHQYGTLRNKIAAGHDRISIYLSSFITCHAAVMIMYVFVWLTISGLGTLLLGGYSLSAKGLFMLVLVSFFGVTMLTALYVMIGLCLQSKSLGSVTAVIAAFLILICGIMTVQLLSAPQYIPVEQIPAQVLPQYEKVPDDPALVINPEYVGGSKRKVYETIHKLCPVSQLITTDEETGAEGVLIPAAEALVLLAAGMLIFKKRDLK
ncbi:MAG: ABC transporter permease [Lachnospiraceae bacterium]|nr:ABC transporter permease [Lachnospiraceae bacterium]